MPYEAIELTFAQSVAVLTLNDPTRLNAVSHTMITELNQAIREVEDPAHGVRCLVLTGAGRGFCSGANLQERQTMAAAQEKPQWSSNILESHYHPFLRRLRQLNMPFITAVNGLAAGVGASLALMGDLVLASKTTYFLLAFRHIGLMPDGGATYILPRLIGLARAMEMAILGERIAAEQALEWGMINRVYDSEALLPEALKLAHDLAAGPTVALKLIRQALWQSLDNTYEQQLTVEALGQQEARQTADCREGVAAFLEKRRAQFTGR